MFKSYFVFFPSFPTKKKLLNNRGKIRFPRFLWDVYKIDVASVSKTWYQWLGWMNASWGAFPCPTSILKELRLAQLYAETEQWLPWPLTRAGELASITDDTWMGWGNYKSLLAGDHRTVSTSPCFLFNYSEKKKQKHVSVWTTGSQCPEGGQWVSACRFLGFDSLFVFPSSSLLLIYLKNKPCYEHVCLSVYVCTKCIQEPTGGSERGIGSIGTGLRVVAKCPVGEENWTWNLWKSNQHS